MSAITCNTNYSCRKSSPLGIFLVLACMAAFAVVVISDHATNRHGADANRIRRCLEQNGPLQIWRAGDVFYRICLLEDERYGIQAIRKGGKLSDVYHEITAFVKGRGTLPELLKYLVRLKAEQWEDPLP
jgi:hypothetical protein